MLDNKAVLLCSGALQGKTVVDLLEEKLHSVFIKLQDRKMIEMHCLAAQREVEAAVGRDTVEMAS